MKLPKIYIDGTEYTFPMSIQRAPDKRESGNSGYMMNRRYHPDYLGTYITYNIAVAIPKGKENDYSNLYDLLAAPLEEYDFALPYNQGYVTFSGKIENIKDKLLITYSDKSGKDKTIWTGISFDIVSNEPILEVDTNENSD